MKKDNEYKVLKEVRHGNYIISIEKYHPKGKEIYSEELYKTIAELLLEEYKEKLLKPRK
ncbi:hypothetical protein ABIE66_001995 [Peribacillus sp. B2I2]|uniref:hypothetical protein n=1 Tax=Peribacillus sp. B2I2 TaxID=3156468 RepID=UPI003518FE6E